MKRTALLFLTLIAILTATAQVAPGIEVLEDADFAPLRGKRVGLITNPTGVDRTLRSSIDILHGAEDVELVALFSPEHGIRGNHAAGKAVADETDPVTGVKVYSLHGRNLAPTQEMLRDIDILIYDIQDIGARSFTYISTMGRSMEACAKAGVEFMVLDRPNPLGGIKVEGTPISEGYESFVGQYQIPYIYGLTPGELARLLCGERMLRGGVTPKLTVIPMEGWQRDMDYQATGLPWVAPSPNIPTAETAFCYPAVGIAGELDGLSIGIGTALPFRLFAVPGTDGLKLAEALNNLRLDGVMFRPVSFRPNWSKLSGTDLSGVEVYIQSPHEADLTLIQFYILQEVKRLYPDIRIIESEKPSRIVMMDKVCGSSEIREAFTRRYLVADLLPVWTRGVDSFRKTKQKYHLY